MFEHIEIILKPERKILYVPVPVTPYKRTGNPKLDAWYAVRQEWIANGGRVTPELLRLESIAEKAIDSRAVHS